MDGTYGKFSEQLHVWPSEIINGEPMAGRSMKATASVGTAVKHLVAWGHSISGVSSWEESLEPTWAICLYVMSLITVTSEHNGSYFTSAFQILCNFPS